jgi:hypothetical protein
MWNAINTYVIHKYGYARGLYGHGLAVPIVCLSNSLPVIQVRGGSYVFHTSPKQDTFLFTSACVEYCDRGDTNRNSCTCLDCIPFSNWRTPPLPHHASSPVSGSDSASRSAARGTCAYSVLAERDRDQGCGRVSRQAHGQNAAPRL